MKYKPLEPEKIYHIYNRGINGETIFKEERNYNYFLARYATFLFPVVDTFAYCLLKNHFHLLIRVKPMNVLLAFAENENMNIMRNKEGLHSAEQIVSKQFARLFSSYTQSINKSVSRTGSLIETPFERKEVKNEAYFSELVKYIHLNPQKHRFVDDFREYPHSSYHSHLANKITKLQREEVLKWYGGVVEYEKYHTTNLTNRTDLIIDFD